MINLDGRSPAVSPVQATYYGRGVHVAMFEAFFDELAKRRTRVYRDYVGHTQPGLIPAWARAQRFLILQGVILRFEHSKISPSDRIGPKGGQPSPVWGHEAGFVKIRFTLRDSVTMRVVFNRVISTWTKSVHSDNPRSFNVYRALSLYLVELLRRDPQFMAALGGR